MFVAHPRTAEFVMPEACQFFEEQSDPLELSVIAWGLGWMNKEETEEHACFAERIWACVVHEQRVRGRWIKVHISNDLEKADISFL